LKRYKSPGSDGIAAELIQAGGEILRSKIHKLIKSIWNKQELPEQWKEYIIVTVHKKGDKTECSNYRGISCGKVWIFGNNYNKSKPDLGGN
jgi:hypothetical protein